MNAPLQLPVTARLAKRTDAFHLIAWLAILAAMICDPINLKGTTSLCLFRHLTGGIDCPGCGLVRSWCATAHGDFGDAIARHLFGPATFFLLLAALIAFKFTRAAGEVFETWLARIWRSSRSTRMMSTLGAMAWILWAAARMVSGMAGNG